MIHFKDVFVVQKSRQLLSQQRVGKDALGLCGAGGKRVLEATWPQFCKEDVGPTHGKQRRVTTNMWVDKLVGATRRPGDERSHQHASCLIQLIVLFCGASSRMTVFQWQMRDIVILTDTLNKRWGMGKQN